MKLLLDTHVLLWAIDRPSRLSAAARKALEDPSNALYVSVASIWEIVLKFQAGKLRFPASAEYFKAHLNALGIAQLLAIQPQHVYTLLQLPPHHKDPFDRLLVAQSLMEDLPIVTSDAALTQYDVQTIW